MGAQMGALSNRLYSDALVPEVFAHPPAGKSQEFYDEWARLIDGFPASYFWDVDVPIIEQYVTVLLEVRGLSALIRATGTLIETTQGQKANPLFAVQSGLRKQLTGLARMLRVGPSTRQDASQAPKAPVRKKAPAKSVVPIAGSR